MPQRETRHFEVRVVPVGDGPQQDGLPRRFTARVLNYMRLDDYGTMFAPGCFTKSLQQRLPRLLYGHAGWMDPSSVLGRAVAFDDAPDGLNLTFEFDDFAFVPVARQIAAQLVSGTLDQFSVGFVRTADRIDKVDNLSVPVITEGRLGETSVVIEGSVPDTKLLAFRHRRPDERVALIDANTAVTILSRMHLGEIDLAEALTAVKSATVEEPAAGEATTEPPATATETPDPAPAAATETTEEPEPLEPEAVTEPVLSDDETDALLAELDDALGVTAEHPRPEAEAA